MRVRFLVIAAVAAMTLVAAASAQTHVAGASARFGTLVTARLMPQRLGHRSAISPPPRLVRPMRWAGPFTRAGTFSTSASTYRGGHAVIGVALGLKPLAFASRLRGVSLIGIDRALHSVEIAGPPSVLSAIARRFGKSSSTRYVEPVVQQQLAHQRNDPATYTIDPQTGQPYEWQFHAMRVDQALNLSLGDPNMLVGIVDSGYSNVPDLSGKIAKAW